ncbi:MAG: hypothetical protein LBJ41_05780 [Treponema sp.]|jgi:hypothetical protein|nr:hypothetical protein [Treponema sp.]
MNDSQRLDQISGLIEYFTKSKRNEMAENAMREILISIPDRDFDQAVSKLFTVSNRFGLDLSAIKSALADIGATDGDALAGYERVGSNRLIHRGTEVQCDCCGHHYLWSQTADDYTSAEKDWWAYCPMCGFNGDVQASAYRSIVRTGAIPRAYNAMLDRQYQHYAERDFRPLKTRNEIKKMLEKRSHGGFYDRQSIQAILMALEQSHKDRARRFARTVDGERQG